MKRIRKITIFGFLLALAFFSSGTCVFTMKMAQAATMDTSEMPLSLHGESQREGHCLKKMNTDCLSVDGQNDFSACALSCGSPISKTAVVKKVQDLDRLSILAVFSPFFPEEYQSTQLDSWALEKRENQEDILLSIAKKE